MNDLVEKAEPDPETDEAKDDPPQDKPKPKGFVGDWDWSMTVSPRSNFY
jgi:hypothetical protein